MENLVFFLMISVATMKPITEPLNWGTSESEYFAVIFNKIAIMVKVITHTKITNVAQCLIVRWKYEENETQTDTNKTRNSQNAYNYGRV